MKYRILLLFCLFSFSLFAGRVYQAHSVLATGKWYKIAVQQTGIYKITYEDLVQLGMTPSQINPQAIRIYGNGGGMLPEGNNVPRIDDLREISIQVVGGDDGSIDPGDYILFYGESPDGWSFDEATKRFHHDKNLYSDYSYYYINTDLGTGKRVTPFPYLDSVPNYYAQRFSDYSFHELEERNLIKSGRIWYGEVFNADTTRIDFPCYVPDMDSVSGILMSTYVAARAPYISWFDVLFNNQYADSIPVDYVELSSTQIYARYRQKNTLMLNPKDHFTISFNYHPTSPQSLGWLNYFELNYQRNLKWTPPQMSFRDANSPGPDKLTEFVVRRADSNMVIWDVTDQGNIRQVECKYAGATLRFRMLTPNLHEFIGFDKTTYYPVQCIGEIPNQDLHATEPVQMVIVSNPLFLSQAQQLADFHRQHSGLSVAVVTTTQVFEEFGSGRHDLTAIRDFMKMLYDRGLPASQQPKFLLLFGDGSYDPKDRVPGNDNLVPTYESEESLRYVGTYVTDDYFGLMGDNEGADCNGSIDIGIGRFPCNNAAEAQGIVDKILHYTRKNDTVMSPYRNIMTFVADDQDSNLHLRQAEDLTDIVAAQYPVFNVNKIYLDSYQMEVVPGGVRFPGANKAINDAVEHGTLIMNYTGHGGEEGWSAEQVLTVQDIEAWDNIDKLAVFITATCEFSRFDNPERLSAGERVILHPNGGAIALYSTTRLSLATSNFKLDTSFFHNLMNKEDGDFIKMGDLIRISKNNNGNNTYIRNFVLLGDPAQRIAYPQYNAVVTDINDRTAGSDPDTTLGLSKVTVKGKIVDNGGQVLSGFSGLVYPKIYDKPATYRTLGNQDKSFPVDYLLQNHLLSDGTNTVRDGLFQFSFVVPKDVMLQLGYGKMSFYAYSDSLGVDATGYYKNFLIGGQDPGIIPENSGPVIKLYMDNRSFVSGNLTRANTTLIADLNDPDGINYYYLGLGHEILATIDDDGSHQVVLNDYYQPSLDDYRSGTLSYPLEHLAPGFHKISVKAWDLYNNSSVAEITFFVSDPASITATHVNIYPNPLTSVSVFRMEALPDAGDLEVTINIYSISGLLVNTITRTFPQELNSVIQISWSGTGFNGMPLSNGLYTYKVMIRGQNGATTQTSQKLIILH